MYILITFAVKKSSLRLFIFFYFFRLLERHTLIQRLKQKRPTILASLQVTTQFIIR